MYPITKGYPEVCLRLDKLIEGNHFAEALLSAVFVFEKTLKRVVRFSMVNRGFTTVQCDSLLKKGGFHDLKELFEIFDKDGRKLSEVILPATWQHVPSAVTMRNKLVHGERVFKFDEYTNQIVHVRMATSLLRDDAIARLNCEPWATFPRTIKCRLQWLNLKQPKKREITEPIED